VLQMLFRELYFSTSGNPRWVDGGGNLVRETNFLLATIYRFQTLQDNFSIRTHHFKETRSNICIRALSAASAAKFNIAPVRWQHPSHVAIVPTENKG
jgi:hypothetical protein